jgi:hypothetical protein
LGLPADTAVNDTDSWPRLEERRLLCGDVSSSGGWVPAVAGCVGMGARVLAASTAGDFVGVLTEFSDE